MFSIKSFDKSKPLVQRLGQLAMLVFFGFVFFMIYVRLDPGFGWHLKYGQLVLEGGIPASEDFAYTMPSFEYVNHEWMNDVAMSVVYGLTGKYGVALLYTFIFGLAIYFSSIAGREIENKSLHYSIAFLVAVGLARYAGVDPRVISWVFFAILAYLLLDWDRWRKQRLFVPVLFAVWANFHGGFLIGLSMMALVILVRSVRSVRLLYVNYTMLLTSVLVTLNTPYRLKLWRNVVSSALDNPLVWWAGEWEPLLFSLDLSLIGIFLISLFALYRYRKKYSLEEFVLYFVFLGVGLFSGENVGYWVLIAGWLSFKGAIFLEAEAKREKGLTGKVKKFSNYLLGIVVFYGILNMALFAIEANGLRERNYYPVGAIEYLDMASYEGEVFSKYDWSGYVVWKLPQRAYLTTEMVDWRNWDATADEAVSAKDAYLELLLGERDVLEEFEKYGVGVVVWSRGYEELEGGILPELRRDYAGLVTGKNVVEPDVVGRLERVGWKKVYEDDGAFVYVSPGLSLGK